jgi:hypothetical protein
VAPLGTPGDPFKPKTIDIDIPSSDSELHLNGSEIAAEVWSSVAQGWTDGAATLEIMASLFHVLPSFNAHITPMGCGVEVAWGRLSEVVS